MTTRAWRWLPVLFSSFLFSLPGRGSEVMLQWFETEWDEMYRGLPEVAEIGYDHIWIPPPTKGPTGKGTKWGNVGYNLYDRFDLGDIPRRGHLRAVADHVARPDTPPRRTLSFRVSWQHAYLTNETACRARLRQRDHHGQYHYQDPTRPIRAIVPQSAPRSSRRMLSLMSGG